MISVFDYRMMEDGTRDPDILKDFILRVVDHGFAILQLFNEESVRRTEKYVI